MMDDRGWAAANARRASWCCLVLHFTPRRIDMADPQVHKIVLPARRSFRVHHTGFHWQAITWKTVRRSTTCYPRAASFRAALPTRPHWTACPIRSALSSWASA